MNEPSLLPARHKLDVGSYWRMVDAGIFGKEDHIELLDGDIIDRAPIDQGHVAVVNSLNEALVFACAGRAIVSPQNAVHLSNWSAPQPDFAVLRRRADFYATGERPGPADVLLLIEVADSSLRFDQTVKLPLYAKAGIGEVWIVNLPCRVLEAYRQPASDGYGETAIHRVGESLALALAPNIVVPLEMIFG